MLDLTIYLMKKLSNRKSLDSYVKPDYYADSNFSKYYIDKDYLEESLDIRGKIYIFKDSNYTLSWANTVNNLAKSRKKIIKTQPGKVKSVILLEVENRIFALSFSNGISLIREEYIENDFGIKTNRKMIDNKKLKSIKSISLGESIISNHKSAKQHIPRQYQLDQSPLSIINSVKGSIQNEAISGFKMTVSGQNQIQLRVNEELTFLPQLIVILKRLLFIYLDEDIYVDNFYWNNEIKREKDTEKIKKLDNVLAQKIKIMIERVKTNDNNEVTRSTLSNIQLYPDVPDLVDNPVIGFYVSGIGYPGNIILENLDEIQIFSRLAIFLSDKNGESWSSEKMISKLKADKIYYYLHDSTPIYLSNFYNSLYFQTSLLSDKKSKYILFQGKWYEIPQDFYSHIEQTINNIPNDSLGIDYIDFTNEHKEVRRNGTIVKSEAEYNKKMSEAANLVLFDSHNYRLTPEKIKKYNLVSNSQVEPCDNLKYDDNKLQLIHAKIGRSGNGVSHLLNQAYVSSILYQKDAAFLTHLNAVIEEQGHENIDFSSIDNQNVIIVLVYIVEPEYVNKSNSKTFPILTAVSIVKAVSELKDLGFDCRLIKVPNKYQKVK